MQRPKNQSHFRPQHRKYGQLTPKIPAKTPINYRQRKLTGQSSALPANRARSKDVNCCNIQRPTQQLDSLNKEKSILTEQQIKQSTLYKMLEQEIASLAKKQQSQIHKMQQMKKSKQKELQDIKTEQHAIKLQIWELRNQTMELKDSIKDQNDQTERLMQQLGITEADFQNQNAQQQDPHQQNQNQSYIGDGPAG